MKRFVAKKIKAGISLPPNTYNRRAHAYHTMSAKQRRSFARQAFTSWMKSVAVSAEIRKRAAETAANG